MEHTFHISDSSNNSEIKPRGRQKERTIVDALRILSPGRETIAHLQMETDSKVKYGQAINFIRSDGNQKKFDNTDRPEAEKLTYNQIIDAITKYKVNQPLYTHNGWKLEKIPADIQPQGRYDPVRNI
jgi:hypothetical protein